MCIGSRNTQEFNNNEVTIAGINTLGAAVLISRIGEPSDLRICRITHTSAQGSFCPRIEISHDGVRVGCSFFTAAALRFIAAELEKFETMAHTHVLQP